jgi:hypothetical protein
LIAKHRESGSIFRGGNVRSYSAILILLIAPWVYAAGQAKGPSLYFENLARDVGTVKQGEVIKQVFQFANKGSGTLEILGVEHS